MSTAHIAWLIVAAMCGYLIGSINPAALIARAKGVDLSASGSGNPGATNAARVLGRRTGIVVAMLDILKGVLPVLIFTRIAGPGVGELAGLFAVLGHITSPFLHGKGGKGVATTVGVLLAAYPLWLIPVLVTFAIVFLLIKKVGLASAAGALGLIVTAIIDHHDLELSAMGVALGLLILVRHRRNLTAAWVSMRSKQRGATSST